MYDKISVNIRGLEALGVKSEQYGSLLLLIIMAKLPDEIRIQVARNTSQEVWDIDSLIHLIQSEIDAREMSGKIKAATEQVKRPSSSKTSLSTAGTFFGAPSNTQSTVPKCVYCTERHFSASCRKVTDIDARKDILRRDKRCFMCLKRGHLVDQCDKSCRNCKRNISNRSVKQIHPVNHCILIFHQRKNRLKANRRPKSQITQRESIRLIQKPLQPILQLRRREARAVFCCKQLRL